MDIKELIGTLTQQEAEHILLARRRAIEEEITRAHERLDGVTSALTAIQREQASPEAPTQRKRVARGRNTPTAVKRPRGRKPAKPGTSAPHPVPDAPKPSLKLDIVKVLATKSEPLVTPEIVEHLQTTFPERYGNRDVDQFKNVVCTYMGQNKELFKCLGRGEGYVLTDAGRAL